MFFSTRAAFLLGVMSSVTTDRMIGVVGASSKSALKDNHGTDDLADSSNSFRSCDELVSQISRVGKGSAITFVDTITCQEPKVGDASTTRATLGGDANYN